jgi:tRNA(Ile)-lysidine synthetase-like protein
MAFPCLEVRRAVRSELADLSADATVLVACSGGADSLSLAAALGWIGQRSALRTGGVSVDHGLQADSAARARSTAAVMSHMGLDLVEVIHVDARAGDGGPEGNARAARYAALDAMATRCGAAAVLLGHTRDDQAETVLLGLARGSGARSLAGMPRRNGCYRRPLLGLARDIVRAAIPADVKPWEDPHNTDPAYSRSRVRHHVLPVLEAELGPGVSTALARTAKLLRADADALEDLASAATTQVHVGGNRYHVDGLARLPNAVRWRVLRLAAMTAGSPATDLTFEHVHNVDMLITTWHGQAGIDLPGRLRATRRDGVLEFASSR